MTGAHLAHARAGRDGYDVCVLPEDAGWAFSGLRVLDLAPGEARTLDTGPHELLVLPLAGSATVRVDGVAMTVRGRADVFASVSDFVYAPRDARVEVTSRRGGRFALPSAVAAERHPARHVPAEAVAIELRGAGAASRQVNNLCVPEGMPADRLIVVEVLTPAGNWSSYPPHKHDEDRPGEETALEEIYYYEVARGGIGYQRVYASGPGREIDICAEVRSGDVILMPHGFHGPSMAAPGYDLYYLNVMAGPGERAWRITDDPEHAWVRDSWAGQALDPRVPLAPGGAPR